MKTQLVYGNMQQLTFPSIASVTARAFFERDPGKLFACKIKWKNKKL